MANHPTFPRKPYGLRNQEIVASKMRAAALARIFSHSSGNAIIVALDDRSISGPHCDGLLHMNETISRAIASHADAILGHPGLFEQHPEIMKSHLAGIMNLTLSTSGQHHLNKVLIAAPETALEFGVDCVSIHVNTTAPNEPAMLQTLGLVGAQCKELGILVLAHMYPRTIGENGKETQYMDEKKAEPKIFTERVKHAAALGTDLRADILKVPYTGSRETFEQVVAAADGRKVVIAGGVSKELEEFLTDVFDAMQAGASGVALGRNFFEEIERGDLVLAALDGIVHHGLDVKEALECARTNLGIPEPATPQKASHVAMKSQPLQLVP